MYYSVWVFCTAKKGFFRRVWNILSSALIFVKIFNKAIILTKSRRANKVSNNIVTENYVRIGELYEKKNQLTKALSFYEKGLVFTKERKGTNHEAVGKLLHTIGKLLLDSGNHKKAFFRFREASEIFLQKQHTDEYSNVLFSMGVLHSEEGLFPTSLEYFEQCINIRKNIRGNEDVSVAHTYNHLGVAYFEINEFSLSNKAHSE